MILLRLLHAVSHLSATLGCESAAKNIVVEREKKRWTQKVLEVSFKMLLEHENVSLNCERRR